MKWYIDFSGYCMIEAETAEEAETKFWKGLRPPCEEAFDDVWDIDNVELAETKPFSFITEFIPGVTNLEDLFPVKANDGD